MLKSIRNNSHCLAWESNFCFLKLAVRYKCLIRIYTKIAYNSFPNERFFFSHTPCQKSRVRKPRFYFPCFAALQGYVGLTQHHVNTSTMCQAHVVAPISYCKIYCKNHRSKNRNKSDKLIPWRSTVFIMLCREATADFLIYIWYTAMLSS